jgi:glycosyl transferase, family 25
MACWPTMTSSPVNDQHHIHIFIISLPKDRHRREFLEGQLRKLELPFSVEQAVHGAKLSPEELEASYDRNKAIRRFNRELSRGEIGCALSHVNIYKKMCANNIPYALVLEDDARILDDGLPETLSKLAALYTARTPVTVLLNHVQRYAGNTKTRLDDRHCLYDAYRGVCAHGYFITQAAAEVLAEKLHPVYVVADKWEYFQERYVQVKALVPYPIGLTDASLASSIDAMGERMKKMMTSRSAMYYARKYLRQLTFLLTSRPFIRLEYQERSELDFH